MLRRGSGKDHLTLLTDVRYLGSHPTIAGHFEHLTLVFYRDRLAIRDTRKRENVRIPWESVSNVAVLDRHTIENSVNLASVALLGVFALAGQNKSVAYLEIEDPDGTWLFAVPGLTPVELRAGLMPIRRTCLQHIDGERPATTTTGDRDPTARIRQLDRLRSEGLITDVEYASRRADILDSI